VSSAEEGLRPLEENDRAGHYPSESCDDSVDAGVTFLNKLLGGFASARDLTNRENVLRDLREVARRE
jgi:hypothetical protein